MASTIQIRVDDDLKNKSDQLCDMLPPLKSLILKWGLLAQWLY